MQYIDKDFMARGKKYEDELYLLALSKGLEVRRATRAQDMYDHIDMYLSDEGETFSVDVKSYNNKESFRDKVAVEWTNVSGKQGWLYGQADYIAFCREDHYAFIPRQALLERAVSLVDRGARVDKAIHATNKVYSRPHRGYNDEISYLMWSDVEDLVEYKWERTR